MIKIEAIIEVNTEQLKEKKMDKTINNFTRKWGHFK